MNEQQLLGLIKQGEGLALEFKESQRSINKDGDIDITDHTRLVADLYHCKQVSYSENKVYPYATLADLKEDLICESSEDRYHPRR